jgi:hypothetical protein
MIGCRAASIEPAAGHSPAEQLIQSWITRSGRAGWTFNRALCRFVLGGRIVYIGLFNRARFCRRAGFSDRTQR